MPRGPAPAWRARKQPVVDDWILASVNQAGGLGKHHPDTGHYSELVIRGLDTKEEAAEWKRALHRCAYYLFKNKIADIGVRTAIERDGKQYRIRFSAINKDHTYLFLIQRYGEDRSKWPYDPRRRSAPPQTADPWETGPSKKDLDLIEENQRLRAQLARKNRGGN